MRSFNFRVVGAGALACALALSALGQNRGFDKSRMDETANACTDFYQFANGNWMKATEIPAAYPSWGSFNILAENNRKTLHDILEESAKNDKAKAGSNEQKVGDFYATCMDEPKREADGAKPIAPYLARIDRVKNLKDLEGEIAHLHRAQFPALFGFGSGGDFKNSSMNIGNAGQGGLSLPNKDYYTKTDADSIKMREAFTQHVAAMFQLLGDAPEQATKNAQTVMAIEMRLAQNSRGPVELRDPTTQYHMLSTTDLDHLTPHFSWGDYFAAVGLPREMRINMAHPEFFAATDKMLADVPLADWKTYLRWSVVNAAASGLSSKFETEDFNFYGKTLQGRQEQYPRWRRCVSSADNNLGEALGQVYVTRAFTPEAKRRMQTMVNNLIDAFHERLTKVDWMSDETRRAAIAKLAAFKQKIGYPDKWIDYSSLNISRDSYAANLIRASEFAQRRDYAKIGKPIDPTEWGMTPPTVNAYNNTQRNEIVFPAGILQPPFFNP
ncbi:MAG: putative endopeptidase, partial [Acidobacteriota bacterium]|nr:putative endopeptidase [Acidobacteriota bacterium]